MALEQQNWTSIYLDLNKWVDLARAEDGLPEGKPFSPVLQAALISVAEGRVIFPLSNAHLMEVAKIGDDAPRAKLASLMVRLSQGWFLAATSSLVIPELRRSLAKEFDIPLIRAESSTIFIPEHHVGPDRPSVSKRHGDRRFASSSARYAGSLPGESACIESLRRQLADLCQAT
jgi:hypothetical protein